MNDSLEIGNDEGTLGILAPSGSLSFWIRITVETI